MVTLKYFEAQNSFKTSWNTTSGLYIRFRPIHPIRELGRRICHHSYSLLDIISTFFSKNVKSSPHISHTDICPSARGLVNIVSVYFSVLFFLFFFLFYYLFPYQITHISSGPLVIAVQWSSEYWFNVTTLLIFYVTKQKLHIQFILYIYIYINSLTAQN